MWKSKNQHLEILLETIEYVSSDTGANTIGIVVLSLDHIDSTLTKSLADSGVGVLLCLDKEEPSFSTDCEMQYYAYSQAVSAIEAVDTLVIYDPYYWNVYQEIGMNQLINRAVSDKDIPILPFNRNAERYPLLPKEFLDGQSLEELQMENQIWHYARRSGLEGGYAEFGTWYGRSFFRNALYFKDMFKGDFHAFDSFGGLPITREKEDEYSAGDFIEGRYFCNEASFRAVGGFCFPKDKEFNDRMKIVKGFYDETLDGHTIADYGIKEKSISFCVIDCDLYDATLSVLKFIAPALEDGCILYLDDYRLGRAARQASEYHAVQEWLRTNPEYDLLELHREHWQHQYFIFNRLWLES